MTLSKKYRLGISTTVDYSVSLERLFKAFSENQFDFVSLGANLEQTCFFNRSEFGSIRELARKYNLEIASAHAPFGGEYDIASSDHNIHEQAIGRLLRFLEHAAEYKIPVVIVHPHHFFLDSKDACLERSARALEMIRLSQPESVRLVIENLPAAEGSWICDGLLDIFDDECFGWCYDCSHENISGPPFHLIERHFTRLETSHLSDNNGKYDEHLIPGDGNIDWDSLKAYFDRADKIDHMLLEVGTGEPLNEPVEKFVERAAIRIRALLERAFHPADL